MKKFLLIIITLFFCISVSAQNKNVKDFGAKGDGVTDDTQAFINALKGSSTLLIPAGTYNIKGLININGLHNKTVIADKNAVIRNTTDDKGTFNFYQCTDISITGGTWTYLHLPTANSISGKEHYFLISCCKNISVVHIHIIGSAETGFNLVSDIGVNISNNNIEQCYRDGIYSHYSSNLVYCGNYIHDIKDDAMSVHDYGILSQRFILTAAGIAQSGNAIIFNNTTRNTYQGFSSIGCTKLFIANNDIQNTVTGGIAVFNSKTSFVGSTARANKIIISNNTLAYIGGGTTIMHAFHKNSGQLNTGRSAIFVGALDEKNYIISPTSRIQYVTVNNNKVSNCFKDGAYFGQVDNLNLFNNFFIDNNTGEDSFTGKTVELKDCHNATINKNTVNDNRTAPAATDVAYSLTQVSGNTGQWNIKSRAAKQNEVVNSSVKNVVEKQKDVPVNIDNFTLAPSEYKIIKKPFSPGLLADYVNLLAPGNLLSKASYNAFLDTDTIVIIIRNTSRELLNIPATGWQVREFYHN